jgi:hypothetical protein
LPKSTFRQALCRLWYDRRQQNVVYEEKYAHLRLTQETIARGWLEYGYRRTTTTRRKEMGLMVNEKVVRPRCGPASFESFFIRFKEEGHAEFLDAETL